MQSDDIMVSLLSNEFETVFSPKERQKLIHLNFIEDRDGQLKPTLPYQKSKRKVFNCYDGK